ncbi:TPA: AP2 domain-containing protein [Staphylococcus pseudintermedius]
MSYLKWVMWVVKSIYLQDGEEIFVDDEDYERVNRHTWTKCISINSISIINVVNGFNLLSFIKEGSFQKEKGNDFTKENLTNKGNKARWSKSRVNSSSQYKGVSWNKRVKKWRARISVNKSVIELGYFEKEIDAARAYNEAVFKYLDGHSFVNKLGSDNRNKKLKKTKRINRIGKSGYKGVSQKNNDFYSSEFTVKQKTYYLGSSKNKEKVALMYNEVMIYLYGSDAILNDVPMTDELEEFISNWKIPERIKALKLNGEVVNDGD